MLAINHSGKSIVLRALIDPGSEETIISESADQRLNLRRHYSSVNICGIGGAQAGRSKGKVTFTMASRRSTVFHSGKCFDYAKINETTSVPKDIYISMDAHNRHSIGRPNVRIASPSC